MKSLLFQENATPFEEPPECAPCRQEAEVTIRRNGRLYRMKIRDKIIIEDPYLVMLKANAFAIGQAEAYNARPVPRSIRDFLIKSSVVI